MFTPSDFRCLHDEQIETLITIISNLIESPENMRYRSLSKRSTTFQNKLCDKTGRIVPLVLLILKRCGFEEKAETYECNPTILSCKEIMKTLKCVQSDRQAVKCKPKSFKGDDKRKEANEQLGEALNERKLKFNNQERSINDGYCCLL